MLKIIFTIIGTFIGAGFASGKEVHLFFFRFGFLGIIGIFFSSFFIGIIIQKTLKIIKKNNIKNYNEFFKKIIKNKKIKNILNKIINIFLVFSFCIMISGFCSFVKQEFLINKLVSGILILTICYFVFQKNINKIVKINNFFIPIILLIILYILFFKNDNFKFYFLENNFEKNIENNYENYKKNSLKINKINLKNNYLFNSILYSNYNLLGIIPVLITMKKFINKKKYIYIIPVIVTIIICVLSLSVFLLLSRLIIEKNIEILNLEMPLIYVVSNFGKFYKYLYTIIIGIAIFTTAISSGYGYLQKYEKNENEFKNKMNYLLFGAIFFIPISFSKLIGFLYPVFGFVGVVQSYYILKFKE